MTEEQNGLAKVSKKPASAVQRAAAKLRDMAMDMAEGTLLGSEEELMIALQVSRPTLRQAAALVAQDRLITIRRGVNGGYFAALPDSLTVSRMAAIYLQSRNARLTEVLQAVEPIRTEIARLASRNPVPEERAKLAEFLEHDKAEKYTDYRAFLRAERSFGRVLASVSGNRVLELFLTIVYDLSPYIGRSQDVYVNRPDRIEIYRTQRNRLAEAILDGDEEMAVLATRRCSAIVGEWTREDMHDRLATDPIEMAQAAE